MGNFDKDTIINKLVDMTGLPVDVIKTSMENTVFKELDKQNSEKTNINKYIGKYIKYIDNCYNTTIINVSKVNELIGTNDGKHYLFWGNTVSIFNSESNDGIWRSRLEFNNYEKYNLSSLLLDEYDLTHHVTIIDESDLLNTLTSQFSKNIYNLFNLEV